MQIQNAPKSLSTNTIVVACRDDGGFWNSQRILIPNEADRMADRYALAHAIADFESIWSWARKHDQSYISLNGDDSSYNQAIAALNA